MVFLLCVCTMLSILPQNVAMAAYEDALEIDMDGTIIRYPESEIQEAIWRIMGAKANKITVRLLKDITVNQRFTFRSNGCSDLTLDFNGKTLTFGSGDNFLDIYTLSGYPIATYTLKDSVGGGGITSSNPTCINSANVNIESGIYKGGTVLDIGSNSTVNLNGGTYEAPYEVIKVWASENTYVYMNAGRYSNTEGLAPISIWGGTLVKVADAVEIEYNHTAPFSHRCDEDYPAAILDVSEWSPIKTATMCVVNRYGEADPGLFIMPDGWALYDSVDVDKLMERDDVMGYASTATTIKFYANDGSGKVWQQSSTTGEVDFSSLSIPAYTRDHYTLDSWNTKADGSGDELGNAFKATSLSGHRFYAQWKGQSCTVTFDTDGGSAIAPVSQGYGTQIADPGEPRKQGYEFAGWVDENDNEVTFPMTVSGDATIKAVWTAKTDIPYTVEHYFQEWGSANYKIDNNKTQVLTGTTGAATNAAAQMVEGFTAKAITQGTVAGDGSTVVKVYYDHIKVKVEIDLDGDGDIDGDDLVIEDVYGTEIKEPAKPVRDDYEFEGWVDEKGNKVTFPILVLDEDMTIKAVWSGEALGPATPPTSDSTHTQLWLALSMVSLAALAALMIGRRRVRDDRK